MAGGRRTLAKSRYFSLQRSQLDRHQILTMARVGHEPRRSTAEGRSAAVCWRRMRTEQERFHLVEQSIFNG